MKDILIITNYFPPETGAASNRIFHLAEGLQKRDFNVSVATPLPNYPTGSIFKEYKGRFKSSSKEHELTIHRLWLYASNSKNKLLRLFAMLSYSFSLIWFFMFHKIPKTVIVQSPPLLVAFTSVLFLRSKKRKIILNVSDLWPLAGLELGAFKKGLGYTLLEKIERFNYKNASIVLGQSEEIITHVESLILNKETFLYRNYPSFKTPNIDNYKTPNTHLKIVYAGLLGIAQGVYKLCQQLDYSKIEFHIYGDGAEKALIEAYIREHPELPIYYHGSVKRAELHAKIITYDVAIIPLLNRIYGSVPSKIFEFSKLGLPLLYFGGGEGETIIEKHNLGWVAQASNYAHLNEVISKIPLGHLHTDYREAIKTEAEESFNFNLQLDTLVKSIL